MKTIITNFIINSVLFTLFAGYGQNLVVDYAKSFGGPKFDEAKNIHKDPYGNIYITGSFRDTADFNPDAGNWIMHSYGSDDAFVSKFSAEGELLWARQFGGSALDQAYVVETDAANNVVVLGFFSGKADFNPGTDTFYLTSRGDYDIFVAKLNPNGEFVWAKQFGGSKQDLCRTMALDAAGNIYVGGAFYGKAFFGSDTLSNFFTSNGIRDICMFKLNNDGDLQWVNRIGANRDEACYGIALDAEGNLYTTGYFGGTVDFDSGPGNNIMVATGVYNAFVAKYNANGAFLWAKQIGGTRDIYGRAIVLDDSLNIYTTGQFRETVDFDPGPDTYNLSVVGYFDIFVSKLDKNGGFVWAKNFGGADIEEQIYGNDLDNGLALAVNSQQEVFVSGIFRDTIAYSIGTDTFFIFPKQPNYKDICILKYGNNGHLLDVARFAGNGSDAAYSILVDNQNNFLVAGHFTDSFYLNNLYVPQIQPYDSIDAFFIKFHYCANSFNTIDTVVCEQFVSPGGFILGNSGVFYDTLTNSRGCDSIITINLTINNSSYATIDHTACDSYSWFGNILDSSGIYYHTMANSQGCDSLITLNLTIHSSTVSFINHTACDSYSWFGNILDSSGVYYHTMANSQNCDSLITLSLTIHSSTVSFINHTACDSYSWFGNILDSSGIYYHTMANSQNCDSLITLNLTINGSTASFINHTACDSYNWFGNILDSSGIYYHTMANSQGCDSVITLDLTVNYSTHSFVEEANCVSYTWFGNTYYSSGTYYHTLPNAHNCDSIITLDLTIFPSYNFNTIAHSCRVFVWGSYTYTTSGIYYHNYTSTHGCDSNYVLNVTVVHNDTNISVTDTSLIANINGATYQWLDCNNANNPVAGAIYKEFVPDVSGFYAVIVTKNSCIDTSACYVFNKIGLSEVARYTAALSPNPTAGLVNISLPQTFKTIEIELYDVAGKPLLKQNFYSSRLIQLNMDVDDGIYLMFIRADGNQLLPIRVVKAQ